MTVLLDANVLVALLVEDHVHHDAAENWFAGISGNFSTCPITQGSLMRLLIREGQPASAAREILTGTAADPRHEFCPDDVPYTNVPTEGIIGHRQVTDAYLAQLARAHGFRLATFDQAMAKLHHDVADLVPDRLPSSRPKVGLPRLSSPSCLLTWTPWSRSCRSPGTSVWSWTRPAPTG